MRPGQVLPAATAAVVVVVFVATAFPSLSRPRPTYFVLRGVCLNVCERELLRYRHLGRSADVHVRLSLNVGQARSPVALEPRRIASQHKAFKGARAIMEAEEEKSAGLRFQRWELFAIAFLAVALVGFVICLAILLSLPPLIERNIRSQSRLEPGSSVFEKWSKPKYEMETRIWTHSVRNPDAILKSAKPEVKVVGPYVFDQIHERKVHEIVNNTVSYETVSTYFFNQSKSCDECVLFNRVWIPNMIYQKFIEAASKPSMKAATAALLVQTPFLEVEVSELLFDGYADPFLDQVCNLPFVNFVCESVLDLPERVGFFFGKNASSTGTFVVNAGEEDANDIGQIISWNEKATVSENWWSTTAATEIHGTDGTLFKPFLDKEKPLKVFSKDLCRSLELEFKEEIEYKGVRAYRYIVPRRTFNMSLEENQGFCNENEKQFFDEQPPTCLPDGMIDLSRCQRGEPPIVFSLPNFLYAPGFVQNSVDGLEAADEERDQIFLDLEPRLGSLFRAVRRSQINIAMWKGKNLSMPGLDLSHFHNTIIPVLKIEDVAEMDEATLDYIKEKLILTERLVRTITITGMAAAICLALLTMCLCLYKSGHFNKKYTVSNENGLPAKANGDA